MKRDPFAELPDELVLALLSEAREQIEADTGQSCSLTIGQISDATGISIDRIHRLNRVAIAKMRRAAERRGITESSDLL